MRKLIYILLAVIASIFSISYVMYLCEGRNSLKYEVNQLKFDWLVLKQLKDEKNQIVGRLLSADIQRVLIDISRNKTITSASSVCAYLNGENINLLKTYDANISISYIDNIVEGCNSLSKQADKKEKNRSSRKGVN